MVVFCAAVRRQRSWSWAAARPPCMGHGLHIRPRRNLTLGLHSNRGRCQLPRGTPLGTATLGGEGCSPLVSRAPYGARCHVAMFPSSFLFRYEDAVGSIGVKWRIALHLAPIRLAASISPQATYMSSVGVAARRPISWSGPDLAAAGYSTCSSPAILAFAQRWAAPGGCSEGPYQLAPPVLAVIGQSLSRGPNRFQRNLLGARDCADGTGEQMTFFFQAPLRPCCDVWVRRSVAGRSAYCPGPGGRRHRSVMAPRPRNQHALVGGLELSRRRGRSRTSTLCTGRVDRFL